MSGNKEFVVVEFDSEDEDGGKDVDVISSTWVTGDNLDLTCGTVAECYWHTRGRNVSKLAERHAHPKGSWTTHKFRVLKVTGKYVA
jgi:hypothetical protein